MMVDFFRKITANIVLAVQVLIVWVLIFENDISTPVWLQSFGRLHPMLLHLPIGLVLITAVLIFAEKHFDRPSAVVTSFLLHLASLTTSLTALMGLFLSLEGGYEAEVLWWHKWMGVVLSFLCWMLIIPMKRDYMKPLVLASVLLIVFTGHYGATLTHGEDFVSGPMFSRGNVSRKITDSTTVFTAVIAPILEAKCAGCHNEEKSKGRLVLTTEEGVKKGGKNGKLWAPGDVAHSLIVERINLPLSAREHMPPADKAQLTEAEKNFIAAWIGKGADTKTTFLSLNYDDTLKKLADPVLEMYQAQGGYEPLYHFNFVSAKQIEKLSLPNRTVFQIARNEPALGVDFYLRESFDKRYLEDLRAVDQQVISINLSNMPFADKDFGVIADFPNLEKLVLNNTAVTGKNFEVLSKNLKLRSLSVSGAPVQPEHLEKLGGHRSLREVFLWNTNVADDQVRDLQHRFPGITWNTGYQPDKGELLRLNPPLAVSEQLLSTDEAIRLKHNLPGIVIRYTVDGSDPDSLTSAVYKDPIAVEKYTVVKARAFREGWLSSDTVEFVFFKRGHRSLETILSTKPEPKYEGEGAETLVNGLKGMPEFYKDPAWIGFRNSPLEATFVFDGRTTIRNITISYARNMWGMCMPPREVEIWAGNEMNNLKLLGRNKPVQPSGWVSTRIEGASMDVPPSEYKFYKVIARPLEKLPAFRNEKKEKGWLMVDEIFFN